MKSVELVDDEFVVVNGERWNGSRIVRAKFPETELDGTPFMLSATTSLADVLNASAKSLDDLCS